MASCKLPNISFVILNWAKATCSSWRSRDLRVGLRRNTHVVGADLGAEHGVILDHLSELIGAGFSRKVGL